MLVLGESSGRGIPFDHVVAWRLERVSPGSRCHVDMKAVGGSNLKRVHLFLAGQTRRPDCVLIDCGHNEFQARFPWGRPIPCYLDETARRSAGERFEDLGAHSYLERTIRHALWLQRLGMPPPPGSTRKIVDGPAFTPGEDADVVADYGGRLDAIPACSSSTMVAKLICAESPVSEPTPTFRVPISVPTVAVDSASTVPSRRSHASAARA